MQNEPMRVRAGQPLAVGFDLQHALNYARK